MKNSFEKDWSLPEIGTLKISTPLISFINNNSYESYLLYQFFTLMVGNLNEPLEGDEERFSQEELEKSPSYDSWNSDETRSLTDVRLSFLSYLNLC